MPPATSTDRVALTNRLLLADVDFMLRSAVTTAQGIDRKSFLTDFDTSIGTSGTQDARIEFVFYSPENGLLFSLGSSWSAGAAPQWVRADEPANPTFPLTVPPNSPPWASCSWRDSLESLLTMAAPSSVTSASVHTAKLASRMAAPTEFHANWWLRLFRGNDFAAEAIVRGCGAQTEWIVLTPP